MQLSVICPETIKPTEWCFSERCETAWTACPDTAITSSSTSAEDKIGGHICTSAASLSKTPFEECTASELQKYFLVFTMERLTNENSTLHKLSKGETVTLTEGDVSTDEPVECKLPSFNKHHEGPQGRLTTLAEAAMAATKGNADGSGTLTVWVRGTLLLLLMAAVACTAGE
ncbi:hypothetical protein TraAM80_09113 [Trypanosoma rangeli]|uniref:Uncharacterized protein n=1 Tax=Trypanosoma rangeli TaxID=5698 RepID=A0A3R7N0L7_TRYRA|nr:uncharacterized protein TraAM80_09113 [Trypanosoma rangeli]RNE98047.1 hypothetical protein TraAM80_09113 [Trypanosoma rangeli]|eukprot:RNE98047.1 hypothetical protein TraAM80_09113 [Trypanosoma rangeli]